jgi:putative transposase
MKKSRYTPEQVVYALKQFESGTETVAATCRKMGVSEATFYNWKKKYSGMGVTPNPPADRGEVGVLKPFLAICCLYR